MLYVTTRSDQEHFPALRPLGYDCAPDGGVYVPFRLPVFTPAVINAFREKSFGTCVAEVLNQLFSPVLSGAEVDFTIGRSPVKQVSMSHRIVVAECWHNPYWNFDWVVHTLTQRLRAESQRSESVTEWAGIAVRIGMLFGIFAQLLRSGAAHWERPVDVAVESGDFTGPMAIWYARKMGLPIGTIVCCGEDTAAWDLLHKGELRAGDSADMLRGLERLISGTLGAEEAVRCSEFLARGGVYAPGMERVEVLRQGVFAAVVSRRRTDRTISSVHRTNAYILSPESAVVYAGLQDYRTTAGEGRIALILAEKRPGDSLEAVASALGLTAEELSSQLDRVQGGGYGALRNR